MAKDLEQQSHIRETLGRLGIMKNEQNSDAKVTHGSKGFLFTFENGYTISVQYGKGNYCSRQDYSLGKEPEPSTIESTDCEIAVWDRNNKWERMGEYDDVVGRVSIEKIPRIMEMIRNSQIEEASAFSCKR